jgi:hypothetical protein
MKGVAFTSGVLLAGVLLFVPLSDAQGDLAKSLVGKWEGEVQTLGQGNREDPHRTLIIRSISQTQGRWVGEARFGVTGKGLGRVQMEVDAGGAHPAIRFITRADAAVRLELLDEGHLAGTFTRREMGGHFGNDRAIKLEKQKE